MSVTLIAFLFAAGFGAWIYSLAYRRTGGNTTNSLVAAAFAAILGFIIMLSIFSFLPDM